MDATRAEATTRGGLLGVSASAVGSACAILLAVTNLALGLTYLLLPARIGDVLGVLFQAGSQPNWYRLFFGEWALTGVLGLAIVGPVTRLLSPRGGGWTDWASRLAYLGYALTIIQGVHEMANVPGLGQLYMGCGTCTSSLADQQTIAKWLYVTLALDPMNLIIVGAVGLWILAVSAVGFGTVSTRRGVLYLGIAAGVLYLAVVISQSADLSVDVVIALAAVVAAAWYAWVGLLLRRPG